MYGEFIQSKRRSLALDSGHTKEAFEQNENKNQQTHQTSLGKTVDTVYRIFDVYSFFFILTFAFQESIYIYAFYLIEVFQVFIYSGFPKFITKK